MTALTKGDWNKLARLGRHLARYPRDVNWKKYQDEFDQVPKYTDSDWARCRRTRRSTSGECSHRGQHMLKFWSKTQAAVSMSSAEDSGEGKSRGARDNAAVGRTKARTPGDI